ncbi:hypothetical protein ACFE04_004958 [Oxalis oulophora]
MDDPQIRSMIHDGSLQAPITCISRAYNHCNTPLLVLLSLSSPPSLLCINNKSPSPSSTSISINISVNPPLLLTGDFYCDSSSPLYPPSLDIVGFSPGFVVDGGEGVVGVLLVDGGEGVAERERRAIVFGWVWLCVVGLMMMGLVWLCVVDWLGR